MRAIVFAEPKSWSLEEVPDPVPGPREVLVRVEAVGICGTDIHVLDGEFAPTRYPIIPGHETSGIVEAVGERVSEVAVGDRVSVDPTLTCGECTYCSVGRSNLCEQWNGSGVARTNGSTAELTVAPVRNVHRLPDGVDLALAALIEPLSCAIHGYDLLPRRMGEHYLIYGAGTMGLMMAQLAPRAGAASVTVVDRNPARLEVARDVGVERVLSQRGRGRSPRRLGRRHRLHRSRRSDRGRAQPGPARRRLPAVRRRSYRRDRPVLPVRHLQRRDHRRRIDGGAAPRTPARWRCSPPARCAPSGW